MNIASRCPPRIMPYLSLSFFSRSLLSVAERFPHWSAGYSVHSGLLLSPGAGREEDVPSFFGVVCSRCTNGYGATQRRSRAFRGRPSLRPLGFSRRRREQAWPSVSNGCNSFTWISTVLMNTCMTRKNEAGGSRKHRNTNRDPVSMSCDFKIKEWLPEWI